VIAGIAAAFVLLLFGLTGYARATGDHAMLAEAFAACKVELVSVWVWAVGKAALRGFRDHE